MAYKHYVTPKRFGHIQITKVIEGENSVYMDRWYIWRCKWFSIRLHHIQRPDLDRWPHDHPWRFISIILGKGYTEHWCRAEEFQTRAGRWVLHRAKHIKRINRHSETDLHRIISFDKPDKGVWTLFLTGRERKPWGFRTAEGWVPWQEYLEAGEVVSN